MLKNVNLRIKPGEMVAIIGATVSGTSTLMNILGYLDRPNNGEYRICGRDAARHSPDARHCERISFIFQRYHLMAELSVLSNIASRWLNCWKVLALRVNNIIVRHSRLAVSSGGSISPVH